MPVGVTDLRPIQAEPERGEDPGIAAGVAVTLVAENAAAGTAERELDRLSCGAHTRPRGVDGAEWPREPEEWHGIPCASIEPSRKSAARRADGHRRASSASSRSSRQAASYAKSTLPVSSS